VGGAGDRRERQDTNHCRTRLVAPFRSPVRYKTGHAHAVACFVMWVDMLLSRARLPDRHSLYVGAAATVYALANLGYTRVNYPLYSVLTWRSGTSAALAIGAILASMMFFFIGSALSSCLERCQRLPPARKVEAISYAGSHWPLEYYDDGDALCCSTACCCCARARALPDAGNVSPTAAAVELPSTVVVVGGKDGAAVSAPVATRTTPARAPNASRGHQLAPGSTTFVGTPIDTADFGGPVHVSHAGGGGIAAAGGSPRGGRWPAGAVAGEVASGAAPASVGGKGGGGEEEDDMEMM